MEERERKSREGRGEERKKLGWKGREKTHPP